MTVIKELRYAVCFREAQRIVGLGVFNVICTVVLLMMCHKTKSMVLTAYTYLTIFDIFSLAICLLTVWVEHQQPTSLFSFGFKRLEVLAVFGSTVLAQLGSLFVVKESIERILEQPELDTSYLLSFATLAFIVHIAVIYGVENKALNNVTQAASSSWLQEHMSDLSHGICNVVPGLSRVLLPRMNPFALFACAGWLALLITTILIDWHAYYKADSMAAICVSVMIFGTMTPMSVYTGKILLQTAPSHVIGQLDKILREAATLDGVLEFRNEHFWTLSFGRLAGSLHVRVRRDADEQMVLAHLFDRLSNIVSVLTVQVFKDDWTRASAMQVLPPNFSSNQKMESPPLWSVSLQSTSGVNVGTTEIPEHSAKHDQSQNHSHNHGHGHSHGHSHAGKLQPQLQSNIFAGFNSGQSFSNCAVTTSESENRYVAPSGSSKSKFTA